MDLKAAAIVLIITIILNLILFAIGAISQFWFWTIIILIAAIAYKLLPKLQKHK